MTIPFTSVPGEAEPGDLAPGVPAAGGAGPPPGPAGPVTIGTTPVLIASAPPGSRAGVQGRMDLIAVSGTVYLGGPGVTSGNGAAVAAALTCPLFAGDQVWACTAAGTATASVLVLGA